MTKRRAAAKAGSRKARIPVRPGSGIAMNTAREWRKRAGQLERQALALMQASEQCLFMAEAIRRAVQKNAGKDEDGDFYAAGKRSRGTSSPSARSA